MSCLIDHPVQAAVCHPQAHTISKSSTNFFGPKLLKKPKEITNVQFIENQNYNYGVPAQQQAKRHRVASNKVKPQPTGDTVAPRVTADIFVYARKRPKLHCEAKFNDVVVVDGDSDDRMHSSYICVNETKLAVDGTPVLRKVVGKNF